METNQSLQVNPAAPLSGLDSAREAAKSTHGLHIPTDIIYVIIIVAILAALIFIVNRRR
jgi:hypothetical protein